MIDRQTFDQPVKRDMRIDDIIQKIATGQEDDYAAGFSLDYPHFKEHEHDIMIAISKQ